MVFLESTTFPLLRMDSIEGGQRLVDHEYHFLPRQLLQAQWIRDTWSFFLDELQTFNSVFENVRD